MGSTSHGISIFAIDAKKISTWQKMLTCDALTPNFEYMGRKCSMLSNFYTVPKIKINSAKRNKPGIAGVDAMVYVWLLVAYNWHRNQSNPEI